MQALATNRHHHAVAKLYQHLLCRRLSLVTTVPLGRKGDAVRTLAVCERLASDHDDMVEKALSWALRELSKADAAAVKRFLEHHDLELGAV